MNQQPQSDREALLSLGPEEINICSICVNLAMQTTVWPESVSAKIEDVQRRLIAIHDHMLSQIATRGESPQGLGGAIEEAENAILEAASAAEQLAAVPDLGSGQATEGATTRLSSSLTPLHGGEDKSVL
jgi:hypothetical protein